MEPAAPEDSHTRLKAVLRTSTSSPSVSRARQTPCSGAGPAMKHFLSHFRFLYNNQVSRNVFMTEARSPVAWRPLEAPPPQQVVVQARDMAPVPFVLLVTILSAERRRPIGDCAKRSQKAVAGSRWEDRLCETKPIAKKFEVGSEQSQFPLRCRSGDRRSRGALYKRTQFGAARLAPRADCAKRTQFGAAGPAGRAVKCAKQTQSQGVGQPVQYPAFHYSIIPVRCRVCETKPIGPDGSIRPRLSWTPASAGVTTMARVAATNKANLPRAGTSGREPTGSYMPASLSRSVRNKANRA
jgi:hypothetical protein